MHLPAFPRPALLPWLLAALSAVMLVVGIVRGDGILVTMGVAGIAVGLLAYPAARLIIGPPPELDDSPPGGAAEAPETDGEDADGRQA